MTGTTEGTETAEATVDEMEGVDEAVEADVVVEIAGQDRTKSYFM